MAQDAHSRLFFAIWPDQQTRQDIVRIMDNLPGNRGRPVSADNLHLTLVFLGWVMETQQTRLLAAIRSMNFPPVTLQLDQLGWWQRPRILWLAPNRIPQQLVNFVNELADVCRYCGLNIENRAYQPHITLARKVSRQPELPDIQPVIWQCKAYSLVQSVTDQQGARYTEIWNSL